MTQEKIFCHYCYSKNVRSYNIDNSILFCNFCSRLFKNKNNTKTTTMKEPNMYRSYLYEQASDKLIIEMYEEAINHGLQDENLEKEIYHREKKLSSMLTKIASLKLKKEEIDMGNYKRKDIVKDDFNDLLDTIFNNNNNIDK